MSDYLSLAEQQDKWVWWKHGVIYHVYLLSFFDANQDGKGDLQGLIQKLDYLKDLGVDAIWISPVFQSPMFDFGYDVSDYYQIHPDFGNMDDFNSLISGAHQRNIRIILDMVLNHTSEQHPWFLESRVDKDHPKRDWYIWKPPSNGRKPNNWKTAFGNSCWKYDNNTGEYYLHSFFSEQPDLNWRNKEVQEEMFRMLSYWLDKGVDGFRFDVINFIIKDKKLRNNPLFYRFSPSQKIRTRNHPKSYKIIKNLRKLLDTYADKMSVGEIYTLPPGNPRLAASYLSKGRNSLHLTFDFSIFFIHWSAKKYFKAIEQWQNSIPAEGWPSMVFSNHDLFRAVNRFGIGRNKDKKARLLALLLLTSRGTPFIYYGEEIGMKNVRISKKHIKDPLGKKFWPLFRGRDRARTPMQWNNALYAGFSETEPWLPVNNDYKTNNVAEQLNKPDSLLNLYKKLIRLRHSSQALTAGRWIPESKGKNNIFSYYRKSENEQFLIIINFSSFTKTYFRNLNPNEFFLYSTYSHTKQHSIPFNKKLFLRPYEGIILSINNENYI